MIKNYPVIYHNGNILVVDKEAKVKNGEYYFFKFDGAEGIYNQANEQSEYYFKIIATSPEAKLEGVPVIEIEETIESLAKKDVPTNEGFEQYKHGREDGFIRGYITAKAKQYTEEDVRKAFEYGKNAGSLEARRDLINKVSNYEFDNSITEWGEYITSLQKRIVSVDLETNEGKCMEERCLTHPCNDKCKQPKIIDNHVIVKEVYYE